MFRVQRFSRLVWPLLRGLFRSSPLARVPGALACLVLAGSAAAQGEPPTVTIGDLTAAQRALIDAEIRRTLGKAQGHAEPVVPALSMAGASASPIPLAPATAGAQPGPLAPAALRPPGAGAASDARLSVTGQARLRGTWRAEVVTDTGVYLLASGQAVPGTRWRVAAVQPGWVTLSDAYALDPRKKKGSRQPRPQQRHFVLGDAQ